VARQELEPRVVLHLPARWERVRVAPPGLPEVAAEVPRPRGPPPTRDRSGRPLTTRCARSSFDATPHLDSR
jgi:hypothetical protein